MLRTKILTVDGETGKELPLPAELRPRVQRAALMLEKMLHKVGERFDIEARWSFDPEPGRGFAVVLTLSMGDRSTRYTVPQDDLRDDEFIRRRLWTPIGALIPFLEEEVDRQLESVRRGIEALAAPAES